MPVSGTLVPERDVRAADLPDNATRRDLHAGDGEAEGELGDLDGDVLDRAKQRGVEAAAAHQVDPQPVPAQPAHPPGRRARQHEQVQAGSDLVGTRCRELEPGPVEHRAERPTCLARVLPSDAKLISAVPDSEPIVPLENA